MGSTCKVAGWIALSSICISCAAVHFHAFPSIRSYRQYLLNCLSVPPVPVYLQAVLCSLATWLFSSHVFLHTLSILIHVCTVHTPGIGINFSVTCQVDSVSIIICIGLTM